MRREEKRITDDKLIDSILQEAEYCMISLSDNGMPYILPMSFGYRDNKIGGLMDQVKNLYANSVNVGSWTVFRYTGQE